MNGLGVKCPNCGRIMFKTTDKYTPDVRPNGSMVRSLSRYEIDWMTTSTTKAVEMTCPECLAPLAPSGFLNVVKDPVKPAEVVAAVEVAPLSPYVCPACGRDCKNTIGLRSHMRTHKEDQ